MQKPALSIAPGQSGESKHTGGIARNPEAPVRSSLTWKLEVKNRLLSILRRIYTTFSHGFPFFNQLNIALLQEMYSRYLLVTRASNRENESKTVTVDFSESLRCFVSYPFSLRAGMFPLMLEYLVTPLNFFVIEYEEKHSGQ